MRSIRISVIVFISVLFLTNCQKDALPDKFFIGSDIGATINILHDQCSYSTYGREKVLWLDVNDDGEHDLKFFTFATDSLGDQDKRGSSVWSINHDLEFAYQITYDDLFHVTKDSDEGIREIIYNERSHFYCAVCQNLSQKGKRITFSSPVALSAGSNLPEDIKWSDKLQILSQLDRSRQYSQEAGTIPIYNNITTGIWDQSGQCYFPFRIKIALGKYQYGWIKLEVIDHRRVEVYEIGLQEIVF